MHLHLHRPGPPVGHLVEMVTYYEGYQPEHTKERLLPDGAVELIVDLTETPKKLYRREDFSVAVDFRKAWISGMRLDWIVIEAQPGSAMAVIRFRPGGAYPVLGFPLEGLTDVVEHLDDVLEGATSSLRDRILEAPTVDGKMAAVERWVLERARGRLETNPIIDYLATRLYAPGGIRVADVVAEIGYSQRHLLSMFRMWVGITPKQYGRLRRFQGVLASLAGRGTSLPSAEDLALRGTAVEEPDWADVAFAHGYYDQSHLARDFREFAGMTPGAYVSAYRGLENYLPID